MKANKEIRVYGTLLNHTLDTSKSNGTKADADFHNDALAYAYQLYDGRFGDPVAVNNYQDIINKRLTAISYGDNVTTIENRDKSKGDPYMLVVKGNTNIGGDLYVDGDIYYKDENGNYQPIDLSDLMARIARLESMWKISGNTLTPVDSSKSVTAAGFYDSTITA